MVFWDFLGGFFGFLGFFGGVLWFFGGFWGFHCVCVLLCLFRVFSGVVFVCLSCSFGVFGVASLVLVGQCCGSFYGGTHNFCI